MRGDDFIRSNLQYKNGSSTDFFIQISRKYSKARTLKLHYLACVILFIVIFLIVCICTSRTTRRHIGNQS